MPETVLEFRSVSRTTSEHLHALTNASFCLHSGDLIIVKSSVDNEYHHIIDIALGLARPGSGHVLFEGRDWQDMNAFEEAECRGKMGFVFETPGWISSLTILENIALRIRHHTTRSEDDIRNEIDKLVKLAGIIDAHDIGMRPDLVSRRRRRIYEWVRACLGPPRVVLMAFPERGAASDTLGGLLRISGHTAAEGAAVMIISDRIDKLKSLSKSNWEQISAEDLFGKNRGHTTHTESGGKNL